jgi:hypothetical protein
VDIRSRLGVEPNGEPTVAHSETALHIAAQYGSYKCVRYLLKHGADRTAVESRGWTPLHNAACEGQLTCLRVLLGRLGKFKLTPAQVNAAEEDGWTALHLTAQNGSVRCCALLMEAGGDLSIRTNKGNTPLQIARQEHPGKRELLSLLDGSVPPSQCGAKCEHCGKASTDCRGGLCICRCGGAFYCGRACLKADWARH